MNRTFEKKLNDLSKLKGYQKPEKVSDAIKLDSNENFAIKKEFQAELIREAQKRCDVRQYPLGDVENLISALAKYLKIPANMIGVGNGSDQILDLMLVNFCSKKTKILTSDPTFGFFEERCKLYSIPTIKIPFSEKMKLNIDDFIRKSKSADMIYLDSPNNPTGFQFTRNELKKLIKSFKGPIVIDEAYVEFSKTNSCCDLIRKHANLLIVRTLSKSAAAAGIRVGYIITNECNVDMFNTYKPAYEISQIAVKYIEFIANNDILIRDTIGRLQLYRRHLNKVFNGIPGDGNFIIVPYSDELYKYLDRAIDMKIVTVDDCDFIRFAVTDYDL